MDCISWLVLPIWLAQQKFFFANRDVVVNKQSIGRVADLWGLTQFMRGILIHLTVAGSAFIKAVK